MLPTSNGMSNLLPHEAQRAIWRMYRARFLIAGSLLALAVAGLSALSLLPSYLALHGGETESASTTPERIADAQDHEAIVRVQSLLAALSPLVIATTTPSAAIAQVLSLRPPTITIDHIAYTEGEQGGIMIVGSAATREAISGYRQALASDTHFKTVSVPVADLAGAPGGRFSIGLTGDF